VKGMPMDQAERLSRNRHRRRHRHHRRHHRRHPSHAISRLMALVQVREPEAK